MEVFVCIGVAAILQQSGRIGRFPDELPDEGASLGSSNNGGVVSDSNWQGRELFLFFDRVSALFFTAV